MPKFEDILVFHFCQLHGVLQVFRRELVNLRDGHLLQFCQAIAIKLRGGAIGMQNPFRVRIK